MGELESRAQAYAALGDPSRLAIVDLLGLADLAPGELGASLDIPTNLMAHHLQILEQAGLISRRRSEGDGRRTYVLRTPACNRLLGAGSRLPRPRGVAFICSQNSARSQLAEHYWRTISNISATSAGTHPAPRVHPDAITVARRHGLDLTHATPKLTGDILTGDELLIAVCDRAYEELDTQPLHWSVPDPARAGSPGAFETAYDELTRRVDLLAASIEGDRP
ncbi:MAG: helix-turn-helix domain-containing protein [Micropruina glycogenica]|uniref:ArsR family transcriptional regulator n=1 Tax=Micropruina glycogenica TaxID=75385 RepID=A0A2N9JD98_9ACTN|nr:helix-turn-helix domain-containing protein [Micropruina glycogenica]MCB0891297.1 helix-turn-helix domain-containing protein [Propionibacteriaceae bacterium]SPD85499.1 ArsR family transcriptional regulator [Micropruina glycogenica]